MNNYSDLLTMNYLILLGSSLLILIVFWLMAIVVRKSLIKLASKQDESRQVVWRLFAKAAYLLVNIIGLISALGTLGVNVSAIVASLGLTGFALGFAMKDVLSNFLAGLMILFYQPYKLGQKVKIDTFMGTVSDIDLRVTTLQNDGDKVLIPNSFVLAKVVIVY